MLFGIFQHIVLLYVHVAAMECLLFVIYLFEEKTHICKLKYNKCFMKQVLYVKVSDI